MHRALIIASMLACVIAHAGPSQDFDAAKDYFRKRDCSSAEPKLVNVLYPEEKIADGNAIFEARTMLGACYADGGQQAEAKKEFEKALQLRPKESLDPSFYSDRARRLFDDTKADIENRAKKDEELRKLQEERERLKASIASIRVFRTTPYSVNFLPFGLNERENGRTLPWLLFGSGQIITLGTSAGIWYYLVNKYGIRSTKVPFEDGPSVRRLQQIEIGAGLAFFGLYAWSVIDSLRHYEPQKRVESDDELIKKALEERPATKPKTSLRERIHFSPMLMPNGIGIGIGWEN